MTFTKRALRGFLCFTSLAAMAGCSSLPTGPSDLLDEGTGITVTVVAQPIVLEPDFNDAAPHDFLTLVAIQQDDDGKYAAFLLLYHWTAFYGETPHAAAADADELLMNVDGRSIDLHPLAHLPKGLPQPKDLFVPDIRESAMRAYATDLETMRLISMSQQFSVTLPHEAPGGSFKLWQDGRPALGQFVKHLSGS